MCLDRPGPRPVLYKGAGPKYIYIELREVLVSLLWDSVVDTSYRYIIVCFLLMYLDSYWN